MASFNKVIVAGNLTRDIELKYVGGNKTAVCELGIAINERVKRNNEWVDEKVFVDCVVWGKTAENVAEYLGKGSSVLVEGKLRLEQWEKEGKKMQKLRIVADSVVFLDGKKPSGNGGGNRNQQSGSGRSHDNDEPPVF